MTGLTIGYGSVSGFRWHQRGFTLFEVAISAVLVTFGVVSILMLMPSGLRAQQHAR